MTDRTGPAREPETPRGDMTVEIKVPDIGDFRDVPIIEVHVEPGRKIGVDDPLITLESDKATMDVPSPAAGTVGEVKVGVGDRVSEGSLILLLSRNFLVMLLLAALIALPATYFFFDKIVLVNFAYHKAVSVAELLISLFLVVVLAFAMIGSQTFKTARTNPSKVLKAN